MNAREAFEGGVAVITGAGSGIGEGLARAAAALGMPVVLADIAAARIDKVCREIVAAGGTALAVPTDVSDPAALQRLAAATHQRFGDVRLLVNNAGIEVVGYSWDVDPAVWERALRINVLGVVNGVHAFVPRMLAAGQPAYIANLSSIGGVGMMAQQAPYIVSKHAVLSFSECLALELQLQGRHIHVSAVLPGPVTSRIFEDAPTGSDAASVAHHVGVMKHLLAANGMAPSEAARIILDGIAARQFWVSTHPEMTRQMAGARARYLAELATPSMTADTLAILGR